MGKEGEKCCVGSDQRSIFSYLKAHGAKVFDFEEPKEPEETEAQKVVRVLAEKYEQASKIAKYAGVCFENICLAPLVDVG
jgi:hypothetical protein